jgi:hypothetical protein
MRDYLLFYLFLRAPNLKMQTTGKKTVIESKIFYI